MEDQASAVLAALYLRGLKRPGVPPRKRWPQVDHAIRSSGGCPVEALQRAGLWFEAGVLCGGSLYDEAQVLVEAGRAVTPSSAGYPQGWRSLGSAAPPAAWAKGLAMPAGTPFTVVGSRIIPAEVRDLARSAGRAIAGAGGVVVSGGAFGCDQEAAQGAHEWSVSAGVLPPVLEVLPHGITAAPRALGGCSPFRSAGLPQSSALSVAAPEEGFTAALAMERNALLYAAGSRSLVISCRLREGGTWAGASEALRRRIGSIWVWDDGSPGARGLIALGAIPVSSIDAFLAGDGTRASLFA